MASSNASCARSRSSASTSTGSRVWRRRAGSSKSSSTATTPSGSLNVSGIGARRRHAPTPPRGPHEQRGGGAAENRGPQLAQDRSSRGGSLSGYPLNRSSALLSVQETGCGTGEASCPSRPAGKTTIREALRPDVKRILIHQYDPSDWRDLETVRGYLRRLLNAEPEGGMHWAEARPAEIFASVEFANGQRRPLQFANGYA